MSWATQSWENTEPQETVDFTDKHAPRRVWIYPGITKRYLFLDGTPFKFFEHSLYDVTKRSKDKCICLAKNPIDERGCPVCDGDIYAAMIGYFSVIDMGEVKYNSQNQVILEGYVGKDDVLFQFERNAYGARAGSKAKPGMLQKIKRQMAKRGGSIKGCVFDIHRSGQKVEGAGDELEFVDQVDAEHWVEYLESQGGNNPQRGDRPLEATPYDFMQVFKPHSYEELTKLMAGFSGKSNTRKPFSKPAAATSGATGASYGGGAVTQPRVVSGGWKPASERGAAEETPAANTASQPAPEPASAPMPSGPEDDDIPF